MVFQNCAGEMPSLSGGFNAIAGQEQTSFSVPEDSKLGRISSDVSVGDNLVLAVQTPANTGGSAELDFVPVTIQYAVDLSMASCDRWTKLSLVQFSKEASRFLCFRASFSWWTRFLDLENGFRI